MELVSVAPNGEIFLLPSDKEYPLEFQRLEDLVKAQKSLGREIVAVMGLGFVGAVMAAVIADAADASGKPSKFVIGVQRPSPRSFWKVAMLNKGVSPFKTEDPKVQRLIHDCVLEKKNLVATYTEEALKLADVVVVDIQCDYHKNKLGDVENGHVEIDDLKNALHTIGKLIQPHALTLIETTVPPGATEHIAYPIIKDEFRSRGISSEPVLAHSYERVMPGRNYVDSIQNFWRVCSGINKESRQRVVRFLSDVLNTSDFPLTVLDRPIESETAKIVENSYRAVILAFLDEWSLFAEQNGVDIVKVIQAIKVRPTHNNIMFPGPGIGGYCLPKDGALGMWAYQHILGGQSNILKFTTEAINVNDTRALHAVQLFQNAMQDMNKAITGIKVAVLGASYREDVGDTRNSGSEVIVRKLAELGAEVKVHDPYVDSWPELDTDTSKAGFFKNQAILKGLQVYQDLDTAVAGVDVVILAVRHQQYLKLDPDEVISKVGKPAVIIDCFGILTDKQIRRYLGLRCVVKGLGRGHIAKIQ